MTTNVNPAILAAMLVKDAGLEVDDNLVDEYALFCETAVINGRPLTLEWLIVGALVKKLGGAVTLTPEELSDIKGIVVDGNALDGLNITAS
jgi:hypothetical protein